MGSKSTTTRQIGTSNMFNQDNNLFTQEIVRIKGMNKNINSIDLGKTIIKDLQTFISNNMFKKFGVAPKIEFIQEKITNASCLSALHNNGYTEATRICGFGTEDVNHKTFYNMPRYVSMELNDMFAHNSTISFTAIQNFNGKILCHIDEELQSSYIINFSGTNTADLFQYKIGTDTETYYLDNNEEKIYLQEDEIGLYIEDNNIKYYLQNQPLFYDVNSISGSRIYTINFKNNATFKNENEEDLSKTIYKNITLAEDKQIYYIIGYKHEQHFTKYGKVVILAKNQIIAEAVNNYHALIYVIKHNGNIVSQNTKYKKVLYAKMGFITNDFDSNFTNNNDVKSVGIVFSTNLNNPKYKSWIEKIYGTEDNRHNITINGEINFHYSNCVVYSSGDTGETRYKYKMYIDGNKMDTSTDTTNDNTAEYMLLPIEIFDNITIKDKYEILKETMNVFWYAEHTEKHSWLATIISFAISIVVMLVLKVPIVIAIAKSFALTIVTQIAYSISPEVGMAVSLFFSYNNGFGKTLIEQIATVAEVVSIISKYYFQLELDNTAKQLRDIKDKEAKLVEKIANIKKKAIFSPLDDINNYYSIIYNTQYDYDNLYNYDNIYQINSTIGYN